MKDRPTGVNESNTMEANEGRPREANEDRPTTSKDISL